MAVKDAVLYVNEAINRMHDGKLIINRVVEVEGRKFLEVAPGHLIMPPPGFEPMHIPYNFVSRLPRYYGPPVGGGAFLLVEEDLVPKVTKLLSQELRLMDEAEKLFSSGHEE